MRERLINILSEFLSIEPEKIQDDSYIKEHLFADEIDIIEIICEAEDAFGTELNMLIEDNDVIDEINERDMTVSGLLDYIVNCGGK